MATLGNSIRKWIRIAQELKIDDFITTIVIIICIRRSIEPENHLIDKTIRIDSSKMTFAGFRTKLHEKWIKLQSRGIFDTKIDACSMQQLFLFQSIKHRNYWNVKSRIGAVPHTHSQGILILFKKWMQLHH